MSLTFKLFLVMEKKTIHRKRRLAMDTALVGMCRYDRSIGKVNRFDKKGKITQSIGNENNNLYKFPRYITENVNRDVEVSDLKQHKGKIVVTDNSGRHCFSYTGPPSGSGLEHRGI